MGEARFDEDLTEEYRSVESVSKFDLARERVKEVKIHKEFKFKSTKNQDFLDKASEDISVEGIPYIFPTLNRMIHGHALKTVDCWVATSGAGKSSFIRADIAALLASGEDVLAFMLEEDASTTLENVALLLNGEDFPVIAGIGVDTEDMIRERKRAITAAFKKEGVGSLLMPDNPTELTMDEVYELIEYAATEMGVKYIVLDNISAAMAINEGGDKATHEILKSMVRKISSLAIRCNTHITVVSHVSQEGGKGKEITLHTLDGGTALARFCMNIIAIAEGAEPITNPENGDKVSDYRVMTILKCRRFSVAGTKIGVRYDVSTKMLVEDADALLEIHSAAPVAHRTKAEVKAAEQGLNAAAKYALMDDKTFRKTVKKFKNKVKLAELIKNRAILIDNIDGSFSNYEPSTNIRSLEDL